MQFRNASSRAPARPSHVALLAGALACGEDSSGSAPPSARFSTGLAPERAVSDLSVAESKQTCEQFKAAGNQRLSPDVLRNGFCEAFAMAATSSRDECESQKSSCVADGDQGIAGQLDDGFTGASLDCEQAEANLAQCNATVGELETCLNDVFDSVLDLFAQFSCDKAGSMSGPSLPSLQPEPPARCVRLQDTCPFVSEAYGGGSLDESP
jgi:hypothetical protein